MLYGISMIILLLVLTFTSAASANSWGLSGPLLDTVLHTHLYDDYSADALFYKKEISTTAAVMESRYHRFLWIHGKDAQGNTSLWVSTTAVYQPEETDAVPVLSCTEQTVQISWPDLFRSFEFTMDENENTWILTKAECGGLEISWTDGRYVTGQGKYWQTGPIDIRSFTVSLFPETEYDVLSMNRVYALLEGSSGFWRENVTVPGKTRIPVYSAADENSYRAAKGKASVSGDENFFLLASYDSWYLVEYEVSLRTHRIGWIHDVQVGKAAPVMFTDIAVSSAEFLTDDPFWSQYRSFTANDLTDIHLLEQPNAFYAYARAKTPEGKAVQGFVPIRGIRLMDEKISRDTMASLCGTWAFYSGGNLTADVLKLFPDGSCELYGLADEIMDQSYLETGLTSDMLSPEGAVSGSWYVAENMIHNGCPFALTLRTEDTGNWQTLSIYSMSETDEAGHALLTLVQMEAGGTWAQMEKDVSPVQVSEIGAGYTDAAADTATYGFGYEQLEDCWKPFFPESSWASARFLIDHSYEEWSAYYEEKNGKPYTTYPIVTVLNGAVQLHVFHREGNEIVPVTETPLSDSMRETEDRKATAPIYFGYDAVGEMDGIRYYNETINLYFNADRDPWSIQIVFEKDDPEDPEAWHVQAVVYQYKEPGKTPVGGRLYDDLVINPSVNTLSYGYGYEEKGLDAGLVLPLTHSIRLSDFRLSDYPENPDQLLESSAVDTKKHEKGNKVNMRKSPDRNARTITQIRNGETIEMLEMENGWCFVKYRGQYGYVMSEYIQGTSRY